MGACLLSRVCPKPVLLPESSCGPFGAAPRAVSPGFFIQIHTGSMRFGKTACAVFSVGDKLARHPVPVKDFSGEPGRKCHDSGRKRLFSRDSTGRSHPAFPPSAGDRIFRLRFGEGAGRPRPHEGQEQKSFVSSEDGGLVRAGGPAGMLPATSPASLVHAGRKRFLRRHARGRRFHSPPSCSGGTRRE